MGIISYNLSKNIPQRNLHQKSLKMNNPHEVSFFIHETEKFISTNAWVLIATVRNPTLKAEFNSQTYHFNDGRFSSQVIKLLLRNNVCTLSYSNVDTFCYTERVIFFYDAYYILNH